MNNEIIIDGVTKYAYFYTAEYGVVQSKSLEPAPFIHPKWLAVSEEIYNDFDNCKGKWFDRDNSTDENYIFVERPLLVSPNHTTTDYVVYYNGEDTLSNVMKSMRGKLPTVLTSGITTMPAASTPVTVDLSAFITAEDAANYTYYAEIMRATSGDTDTNMPVTVQVHTDEKTLVIGRYGTSAAKEISVEYRIIRQGL